MAYNDNDVTSLKGEFSGPIFRFKTQLTIEEVSAPNFDPLKAGGIYLGEMHTDGIENEESADANPVKVWSGRKLRTIYTNWADVLTTNLVGKLDADVSRAIYGDDSVTVANGITVTSHGNRQPPISSILVRATADDGRRHWFFAPKAQPDINMSQSWNEADLVSLPVTWGLLEDPTGKTHHEITFNEGS